MPISEFIQKIVIYLLGFISIIAVIYIIYAGFQIMIGGWDEEKVKKSKNIILYVFLGMALMWFAYSIVNWAITLLDKTKWASIEWRFVEDSYAAEGDETFADYQNKLRIAIQTIEWELRVNKSAQVSSLQNLKTLLQAAYERLPDVWVDGTENDTAKRSVDIDIDVAIKNPTATNLVGTALSRVNTFISSAKIKTITGDVSALPSEWNAPMTVSFHANNIRDPSWVTPESWNYIWWMRWNGGRRIELGRGASFTYTFTQEGSFAVFLDVLSTSRNSKWKIDVLPLTVQKQIEVKPRLGEIILLINGVNVSNMSSLKINPNIGNMWVLFDATASRAIWNGTISETTWDFWNGNTITYKWNPIIERQLYTNQGKYPIKLTIKTNGDQVFTKEFQLLIMDPIAVIQIDSPVSHVGENMNFRALSYFTNQNNVEYSWSIQDGNNKKVLKSGVGTTLAYKFEAIGDYIVTLTSRNPNGSTDADSKTITIESREPVVNMNTPTPKSIEKPNTFIFDASKSYDPDTISRKWLTFTWRLDGQVVSLDKPEQDFSKWELTFDTKWTHTISLTVANIYGKVTTVEKTFEVVSLLSVWLVITPEVGPLWTTVSFIARSENASFYEWNMWDGSAPKSGNKKVIQHIFDKTGVYKVTLVVKNKDWTESNQIARTIYATDAWSPFANIYVSNGSNTAYEDPSACANGAIVLNRGELSNFDASKSLNIDGLTSGLSYTWEYFWKTKTIPYLSEKFSDLGCFPVKLTVRWSNGATHTTTQMIALKNQPPEFTSISTSIDGAKKDAQKLLVKVTVNGAKDADGVITSYIWYYTTESDKEPQNVQITQKNEITFVLPNITEKYYFGVILEDNDGGRINSTDSQTEQAPLLIDNQNGNVSLPLIALTAPKLSKVWEKNHFSVDAKTILGTSITPKSEYSWDFDGDGKMDVTKSPDPSVDYIYQNAGTYTMKVRVTYNGVSNTKYQTITVKNPLKAAFYGFKLQNGDIYLLNASQGSYEKALWRIGTEDTESLYSITIPNGKVDSGATNLWTLTISSSDTENSSTPIDMKDVRDLTGTWGGYQSSPLSLDNTIHISGPGQKVLISLVWNPGTKYVIDEDISIDSDLDGIGDNDVDNTETASLSDGSVFSMQDFGINGKRNRIMKVSVFSWNVITYSENIKLVLDYLPEENSGSGVSLVAGNSELTEFDKKELDTLSGLIRSIEDENRIILMQLYNTLIENWDDSFSKAKTLIELQEKIEIQNISDEKKWEFIKTLDALLVGDSQATDDVTLAAKLIEWLIPTSSKSRTIILEKLELIKSHPTLLTENKILAQDILKMVEVDDTIENKYKLHIKNQIITILNGGIIPAVTSGEPSVVTPEKEQSWILSLISGVVRIFFILLGVIIFVILLAYLFYRLSRRNQNIGFQDFLIDSVFHAKKQESSSINTSTIIEPTESLIINTPPEKPPVIDPLVSFTPIQQSSTPNDPLDSIIIPPTPPTVDEIPVTIEPNNAAPEENLVPDWLKGTTEIPLAPPKIEETPSSEMIVIPETDASNTETPILETHTEEIIQAPSTLSTIPGLPDDRLEDMKTVEDILLVKDPTIWEDVIAEEKSSLTLWDTEEKIEISPAVEEIPAMISNDLTLPPVFEREDNMPDWLSLDPNNQTKEVSPETEAPKKTIGDETLPDWLVASAQPTETTQVTSDENQSIDVDGESLLSIISGSKDDETANEGEEESIPKKKKVVKPKKISTVKSNEGTHDHIPDWLK